MLSRVSGTAGSWVLTLPFLVTGRRAPERWDASWHPGLILTSINTSRGSPWSDYRGEWIRSRKSRETREEGKREREGAEEWTWVMKEMKEREGREGKGEQNKQGDEGGVLVGAGGGWWQQHLSGVHKPAAVGLNDGGHWHTARWGRLAVINTTWWGVWVPSDVHQNGICFSSPFNRWEECETNWAKLQGHLLINQAEKRGEHIRSRGLGVWGQRHGVLIGEMNRYLGVIGWRIKSWRSMKYLKAPWQQHLQIHRKAE